MSENQEKIPFAIEINRVIEVLAAQIYPTPFALLRENVQNSYDAILQRIYNGQKFDPFIDIIIESNKICVTDNGKGMSRDELRNNFWKAGSSSKNTEEARAAGVVGTFGIGAMANFGIAEDLIVETESAFTNERTTSAASRSTLSVTEKCISFVQESLTGKPGTKVTAVIQQEKSINVTEADAYISQFVSFLPIEVKINGKLASKNSLTESVPKLQISWRVTKENYALGDGIKVDLDLTGAINGEVRIELSKIEFGSQKIPGTMVLRQGVGSLRTFRSGFGLATTHISSLYQFGGMADFLFLQPTAGREALTTESISLLQKIVNQVDEFVSIELGGRPESNSNAFFFSWASSRQRYDLCSHLRVQIEPGDSIALNEVRTKSERNRVSVYPGIDPSVIKHASEDQPIVTLSRSNPRRDCELNYLRKFCKIEEISDDLRVLSPKNEEDLSSAEKGVAFKINYILSNDYFTEAKINFGTISHSIPVLVTSTNPVVICLDSDGATLKMLASVWEKEYSAFGHLAKDFVRNMIFPRIADLVPSSTRQGAEAFLKSINRTREVFEYEESDRENLRSLWQDYQDGKISLQHFFEGAERVAVRSEQVVEFEAAANVKDVVPDVIQNETSTEQKPENQNGAAPSIERLDLETTRKLLTLNENESALKGYRCFLALTDRVKEERGEFFLQPHKTSVVWGGQKALFIFEHHSGNFGLYYDLQTQNLLSKESGGGAFETCTIVMKNKVFIPIPPAIQNSFLPKQGERKRFEVKCDILYIDSI